MHKCGKPNQHPMIPPQGHVNAFVDLNGIPYLLAEYLDRSSFLQMDRSMIRSEIFVDTRESMRAVVDISIDDIGKRASDGYPAITGNNSKQKALLNNAAAMAEQLNHQFDVMKRGIVMRVNYQLENQRTGGVLRSMVEDLRIRDRTYFLDVNPRDINDNAVIVNFSNSLVSTINEFTHGRDPMVLRITNVQMFYECLRRDPGVARIRQATPELDYYNYHEQMQNRHIFSPNGSHYDGFGCEPPEMIMPPSWSMFSRYYHFDQNGHDIVLHKHEVTDPLARAVLVPCGTVQVNRAFLINPGHRIIFKFSVWKNDVTVVSDALPLAEAIRTPYLNCCTQMPCENYRPDYGVGETYPAWVDHRHPHDMSVVPTPPGHHGTQFNDPILEELKRSRKMNEKQNQMINQLATAINGLREIIGTQHEGTELPAEVPTMPDKPTATTPPHHHHHPGAGPVVNKLDELAKLLQSIKDQSNQTGDDVDTSEIDAKLEELEKQLEDIRTYGTDGAAAEQIKQLEDSLNSLQEDLNVLHPKPIPDEKVNELLDKIQNA